MDKITKVNVEGDEYGFVAGQTVKGVSGALSADYVKHVILPEGAEVVEGMLVAVTFVNENTAGYSGEKTVYSTDGINFYWDSGYTQLITLPPQGCYTVYATETQYEYKLSEYPVLVMGDMTKPFCDSRGHPAGGKLWQAGDTVTVINLENRFIALQTTVNEIIQGSSLPVTSGAVYEKCNSLEPVNEVTSGNMHSVTSNAVAESYFKKLWQNPSPSSEIGEGYSINLPVSQYRFLVIIINWASYETNFNTSSCIIPTSTPRGLIKASNLDFNSSQFFYEVVRNYTLAQNSITFTKGYFMQNSSYSGSIRNDICIPAYIYGIK